MLQGECRVDMAQKMSACIIFGPRTARSEASFSGLYQLLIYLLTGCPLSRIAL